MFTLGDRRLMHLSTYGLALFFILLPFEYPLAALGTQSVLMLVGVATMGMAAIDLIATQRFQIQFNYRLILTVAWVIYAGFSIMWCNYQVAYSYFYIMYLRNCLMFILIAMINYDKDEVIFIKKAAIAGVGLLMLYMTFVPGATRYSSYQHRLELVAGTSNLDENYLAAILLIGFGFVIYWFINDKEASLRSKAIALLYCGGCIYYIFATGSRSGLISAIVILIIVLAGNIKKNTLIVLFFALLVVVLYPYLIELLPQDLASRYSIAALTGNTSESSPRLIIWAGLLSRLKGNRVLIGFGAGASSPITREVYVNNAAAHNFYIGQIVEFGLVGCGLIFTVIAGMGKQLFKDKNIDCLAMLCGTMVMGMFLDLLTTKFFWSTMMLACIFVTASTKQSNVDSEEIEESNI